ncbi:MAG: hypothetical protein JSV86_16970 [Gemmatimonadota bacterium]|nr:MAG: hypothetical protein JSV86_16970 [Gemmatimonadota bacterium]
MAYYRGYKRGGARKRRKPAGYISAASVTPSVRDALTCDHRIVRDIAERFERYGSISPKQAALVKKLAAEAAARKAEFAARAAKLAAGGVTVPTGKTRVEGTVVAVTWKDGFYPGYKMLVEADAGWRVWGTLPAALRDEDGEPVVVKGDRIAFTGTLKASDDDPAFGFVSRPSGAEVKPSPARAVAECVAAMAAYAARRKRDEATAVAGLCAALGAYWARGAVAVSGAVAALGAFYARCTQTQCDHPRCYRGWIRPFSAEYPCGTCEKLRKRAAAWKAKCAPFRGEAVAA